MVSDCCNPQSSTKSLGTPLEFTGAGYMVITLLEPPRGSTSALQSTTLALPDLQLHSSMRRCCEAAQVLIETGLRQR